MVLRNIEDLCNKKGVSIARLEADSGIGNGTIKRWEKSTPTLRSLQKIATYFGVGIEDLLEDEENPVSGSVRDGK